MTETIGAQLRRVGLLPALAVTLAAALATFALLQQIIPISPNSAQPKTLTPVTPASQKPIPLAPVVDPAAAGAAAISSQRNQSRQSVNAIQSRAAAAARRSHPASAIPAPALSIAGAPSVPHTVKKRATGSGGALSTPSGTGGAGIAPKKKK
jgi:hypothetical protein